MIFNGRIRLVTFFKPIIFIFVTINQITLVVKNFIMAFFLLTAFAVDGQILNMEKYRADGDSLKKYALNIGGSLTINNRSASADEPVNLFGYNFSIHGIYKPKKHAFIFIAHRNFLRINDSPFLNFGYAHARVNFLRENKLNYEVFTQISDDNFRGLRPRVIAGGSLRYRLVEKDNSELIFGTGGFYEYEKWIHPVDNQNVEINLLKSTNNIVFRFAVSETFNLNGILYYQVGYDKDIKKFRNRYSGEINLNAKISKKLNLVNSFNYSYEDRPIVPVTPFIFSFTTGINMEF